MSCWHFIDGGNEESIAEPCADSLHSSPQIGRTVWAPLRSRQTHELLPLPVEYTQPAEMSEREWLARSPLIEPPDTLGCEPIDLDVAVLATYMGVPKEGSSAGVTIVTGRVSALKKQSVRNDIAMTDEIAFIGKVLAVGGIQQKIRAAYEAGVKEVLLPADNLKEARELPSFILDAMKLTPIQTVDEALRYALVDLYRSEFVMSSARQETTDNL